MVKKGVHEKATVEKDAIIGAGTRVWHYAHVREGAVLGKNCVVGHCTYVGKDTKIGNNVKIGNKASVFIGVTVEDDVCIGPHVVFTNDMRPRSTDGWSITKTLVKRGASIGSNSTIVCGITIGSNSMVGAGSVVTRDVPDNGLVYGNPARLRGFVCSCGEDLIEEKMGNKAALMKCTKCGQETEIPVDVYKKVCE